MQAYAGDPTCRVTAKTKNGGDGSALDLQRAYLALAERYVHAPFMPPWATEACRLWRATRDALEHAPAAVATTLDWDIKFALYQSRARANTRRQTQRGKNDGAS